MTYSELKPGSVELVIGTFESAVGAKESSEVTHLEEVILSNGGGKGFTSTVIKNAKVKSDIWRPQKHQELRLIVARMGGGEKVICGVKTPHEGIFETGLVQAYKSKNARNSWLSLAVVGIVLALGAITTWLVSFLALPAIVTGLRSMNAMRRNPSAREILQVAASEDMQQARESPIQEI
ncbi:MULTISPECIES: hypothetical protein [unclassified Thioalkalivibrio]|nr:MULTISPECIES: hypothetical protein [unclassified Thioalkalivibrio]